MRLKDTDALIEHLRKDPIFPLVEKYGITGVIEAAPTIDAVPVVRCKDCKYWQQARPNSGNCSMGFAPTAYADDFCSFGERSEDGEA